MPSKLNLKAILALISRKYRSIYGIQTFVSDTDAYKYKY